MAKIAFLIGPIASGNQHDQLRSERIELNDAVPLAPGLVLRFNPAQYGRTVNLQVESITFNLADGTYELSGTAADYP